MRRRSPDVDREVARADYICAAVSIDPGYRPACEQSARRLSSLLPIPQAPEPDYVLMVSVPRRKAMRRMEGKR